LVLPIVPKNWQTDGSKNFEVDRMVQKLKRGKIEEVKIADQELLSAMREDVKKIFRFSKLRL
jgi:hypothetical protein